MAFGIDTTNRKNQLCTQFGELRGASFSLRHLPLRSAPFLPYPPLPYLWFGSGEVEDVEVTEDGHVASFFDYVWESN